MRLVARVPATVANLGPGFDAFGLALALYNEITVDMDADPSITIEGEGAKEIPTDESNIVAQAMHTLAAAVDRSLPSLSIRCTNRIPLERGLGSSAAAAAGGVLLAQGVLGTSLPTLDLVRLAATQEGHADNVGAAFLGGIAIVYETGQEERVERLDPSSELRPVVLIPERERINTREARAVLPDDVARADATFNAAHAALAVVALTSNPELLEEALEDRLHQERRLELAPGARSLFGELKEQRVPVCVAGSGPTLLAFETEERPVPDPGAGWRALRLDVDREGAKMLEQGHFAG